MKKSKKGESFGESICTCKASIVEAKEDQSNLLGNLVESNNKSRQKNKEGRNKRKIYQSAYALSEGLELTLNALKSEIFPIKST